MEDRKVSFLVAECNEFQSMGRVYEDISTIEEAVSIYKGLPETVKSMIPGISIKLNDTEYTLFTNKIADLSHYPESIQQNGELQQAIRVLGNEFGVIKNQVDIEELSQNIYWFYEQTSHNDVFSQEEHQPAISIEENSVERIKQDLLKGDCKKYIEDLNYYKAECFGSMSSKAVIQIQEMGQDICLVGKTSLDMDNLFQKVPIGIESTEDYSNNLFHAEETSHGIENRYRLVYANDKGRVQPLTEQIFNNEADAMIQAGKLKGMDLVSYNVVVERASEIKKTNLMREEMEQPEILQDLKMRLQEFETPEARLDSTEVERIVSAHSDRLRELNGNRKTVVINAYGGAGAGKTTACLQIASELKKQGYVAEYIPEYAKDLVWEEKYDLLDGTEKHQYQILQEQLKRMDRLYGKVDFIVTDAPVLLNAVYNKELSAPYEKMLSELNKQYTSFNFLVERDNSKFEQAGRLQNLQESIEKDGQIKELLKKNKIFYGTYNHQSLNDVVHNAVEHLANQKAKYQYRGFANSKDGSKMLFGKTEEEVLKKAQSMNSKLDPEHQFATCNIGKYNPVSGKYENNQKFDVKLGKNVTPVFLDVPNGLSKEEFIAEMRRYKEAGAKFNPTKKRWYIMPDQVEEFHKNLNQKADQENPVLDEKQNENKAVAMEQQLEGSALNYFASIDNQYIVQLTNGDTVQISQKEIVEKSGVKSMDEIKPNQLIDILEKTVEEHIKLLHTKDYDITISNDKTDNWCDIHIKKTGQTIELRGDQFGVHFPSMAPEDVKAIVEKVIKQFPVEAKETVFEVGKNVSITVPEYHVLANGIPEIKGIQTVEGILQKYDSGVLHIEKADKSVVEVKQGEVYNERQVAILKKAIEKEMQPVELDIIGQPQLSAAQMEQTYWAFQDGMCPEQVALFANPKIDSWQMDLYRMGISNGIPFDTMKDILNPTKDWIENRQMVDKMIKTQRNLIIKDLDANGIRPEKRIVSKMERVNGLSGKTHNVKDILTKVKTGSVRNDTLGQLYKDLGSEFKRQQAFTNKIATPQMKKIPMR